MAYPLDDKLCGAGYSAKVQTCLPNSSMRHLELARCSLADSVPRGNPKTRVGEGNYFEVADFVFEFAPAATVKATKSLSALGCKSERDHLFDAAHLAQSHLLSGPGGRFARRDRFRGSIWLTADAIGNIMCVYLCCSLYRFCLKRFRCFSWEMFDDRPHTLHRSSGSAPPPG